MDKIYLGNKLESFESSEPFLPVSRVILKVDSQNGYIAGDESGRTIEKTMPWASQEMADSILASLKGQVYKPYSGSGALLDPAAELGDALTVAGEYGVLAGMSRQLDRMGIADISAPGADELDDEFPYTPKSQREVERVLGKAYSRISKTAEKILFEVKKDLGNYSTIEQTSDSISAAVKSINESVNGKLEKYATLTVTDSKITSAVSSAKTEINNGISNTLKSYSTIEQTSDSISAAVSGLVNGSQVDSKITTALNGIELSVSNGSESSTIKLTSGTTELSSQEIKMTGFVTFSSLSEPGQTSINGANIMTGTLTAESIDTSNLTVNAANIVGQITVGTLPSDAALKTDIPGKLSELTNDEGFKTEQGVTEIINGRVTADYIEALEITVNAAQIKGTLTAGKLEGKTIRLNNSDGTTVARLYLAEADTADYKLELNADAIAITSEPGNIHIGQLEGSCFLQVRPGAVVVAGTFRPNADAVVNLGTSSNRWDDIYAVNTTIQTSDRREKKDIRYGLTEYDTLFDALTPCTFRFVEGHERIHMGMIAQDIEEQMAQCGIDSTELAAFIKSPDEENGGYSYGLRYGEFISLLIAQVQKLKQRVKNLEESI